LQTLQELGEAVAARRKLLGLKQGDVAAKAGVTPESLSRFERGRGAEFGSRKLLAVLAVLGAELEILAQGQSGNLDALRRERANPTLGAKAGMATKTGAGRGAL
jgi:HTH-type transcriptional regulator / antitoxin HipB